MELKDIKDVLTFAAFRPEEDNPKFAWSQRFPKKKSVLINISRGHVSWCTLNKKGKIESVNEADGEFPEVAGQMADFWQANTEDGWVGISLNNRFIISLEHNLSRKKGWQEELRQTPKSILGSKYDKTKRYALHHNPETSASLMMACDDSLSKSIEETLRSHSLKPARICVGLFGMTAHLMNQVASDNSLNKQDLIIVTWLDQSLCVIRQKDGQWQDLRCRSGLQAGDDATIAQMLKPFIAEAQPSTCVLLMEDKKHGNFSTQHLSHFGALNVTDVTEEHNLWNILSKY